MKMMIKELVAPAVVMAGIGAGLIACSGAGEAQDGEPLAEGMGAIEARISVVPEGTQCIEIRTSDYRRYQVRTDVTPGLPATIRLAPLAPGPIYLSGTAYSVPCWSVGYGGYGGGYPYPGYDDGTSAATWVADGTSAVVQAGRTNTAVLIFRKLGDLDVDVTFVEPCLCDDGGCMTVPQTGGDPQACSPVVDGGRPDAPRVFSDGGVRLP